MPSEIIHTQESTTYRNNVYTSKNQNNLIDRVPVRHEWREENRILNIFY